jgi:2-polyprenyl-3-methyl-5-hydroxy-6-metoxy-1,4-benzoquinol methylase
MGISLVTDIAHHRYKIPEHLLRYLFAQQFVKGRSILDVGCGAGYGSAIMAKNGARRVVGVDLSEESILYARKYFRMENLEFMVMDAKRVGFEDESFDVVISMEVIEHIAEQSVFLEEIKRVFKEKWGLHPVNSGEELL